MKRLRETRNKIIAIAVILMTSLNGYCHADVVSEVSGGGEIQSSKLGQGVFNIVRDFTGTLQWVLPIVGVLMAMFYLFKIMTGDEQDQQRYKKSIMKVAICIIGSLVAVTIVNLIAKYFV